MVAATSVDVSQLQILAAANFPSEDLQVSQLAMMAAVTVDTPVIVSQLQIMVAVLGRTNNPKVRAWPYTLDGHDNFVLHLGSRETLQFDNFSKEWSVYGSDDADTWRASIGFNWTGGRVLTAGYGSDVVVGDDGNGAIYVLAPDEDTDDDAVEGADLQVPFTRKVTGQYVIEGGYDSVPCYGIQLFGSIGQSDEGAVQLEYSDDRGVTYTDAGSLTIPAGDDDFRLKWPSLGGMKVPGRLFSITDTGAMQRIDGIQMEVKDGEDA